MFFQLIPLERISFQDIYSELTSSYLPILAQVAKAVSCPVSYNNPITQFDPKSPRQCLPRRQIIVPILHITPARQVVYLSMLLLPRVCPCHCNSCRPQSATIWFLLSRPQSRAFFSDRQHWHRADIGIALFSRVLTCYHSLWSMRH